MSKASAKQNARAFIAGEPEDPVAAEVFAEIRARGGQPAMMHRVLAVAPEVFAATYGLAIALRTKTALSRALGELMILRTVQHEGGAYEFAAHRHLGLQVGLTAEQVDGMNHWTEQNCYSATERAVLAYADALANRSDVPDDVYAELAVHLAPQEIIELTMTAGFYVAATRMSAGLKMHVEH